MSLVRYELGFIPQKTTFFIVTAVKTSNLNITLTGWAVQRRRNMSLVRYELGFIPQKTTFFIVTAVKTSNLTYH
jgi:hypothetical protein